YLPVTWSMSFEAFHLPQDLAIGIFVNQVLGNIIPNTGLQRRERALVANLAQPVHYCLSEVLILGLQLNRHINDLHVGRATERPKERIGQIHPSSRLPSAQIIQARKVWV